MATRLTVAIMIVPREFAPPALLPELLSTQPDGAWHGSAIVERIKAGLSFSR